MKLTGTGMATRGADAATRFTIISRHLLSFVRHLTPRKAANFILAETERILAREHVFSSPYILKIESTNICNLHCTYCYDGRRAPKGGEREYGKMSIATFKKIIDEVGNRLFKINLYGFGEPFLFKETFEMIEYATRKNIGVAVSSNMHFTSPELPEKIINSGLEVLIVSCHGISTETHLKFTNNGNFDLAMRNIRAVADLKRKSGSKFPIIDWQYCVTGFNEHEISQAKIMAKEIGVDSIRFIRPYLPDNPGQEWETKQSPRVGAIDEGSGCAWFYRAAYINWDGGVLPCCRDTRNLSNDFGTIAESSLKEIWNGHAFKSARRLMAGKKDSAEKEIICSNCPAISSKQKKQTHEDRD